MRSTRSFSHRLHAGFAAFHHHLRSTAIVASLGTAALIPSGCDELQGVSGSGGGTEVPGAGDDLRFLVVGGKTVAAGEVYEPMTAQGLKPFSFSMNSVTLANATRSNLRIEAVTLTPLDGALPGEWSLRVSENEAAAELTFAPVDLAPGEAIAVATRYFPQQTGVTRARLNVRYGGGEERHIILSGRGRDAAFISDRLEPEWQTVWGHPNSVSKLLASGLVVDSAGNSYISGNATQWGDGFNHNIVLAKFAPNGSVAWAKEWNEVHTQEQGDTGQNNQSGGSAASLAHGGDGHIYAVGRRSTNDSNNAWQALVMKVAEGDGALAWAKGWVPSADSDVGAEAYAVDATMADRVLVTGTTSADGGGILFAALSKSTGAPLFAYSINVGGTDVAKRGYSVVANANGDAYLVGWSGDGFGVLMRLTGCNTNEPQLAWARAVGLGVGSSIHSVDMGSDGNAYIGFDIRGATTLFAFARFNADGQVAWSKFYDERNQGDQHTQYAIQQHGDHVWIGGRIGLEGFDYTGGDALLLRVSAVSGAYDWANVYYTGTTAETMGDHRVKGIAFAGDSVHVLLQHWTSARNSNHYWGHWYAAYDNILQAPFGDGAQHLGDYELSPVDITREPSTMMRAIDGGGRAIAIDAGAIWTAPPSQVGATPVHTMSGNGSHNTAVVHRLTIDD
jgi:hypothetical protein